MAEMEASIKRILKVMSNGSSINGQEGAQIMKSVTSHADSKTLEWISTMTGRACADDEREKRKSKSRGRSWSRGPRKFFRSSRAAKPGQDPEWSDAAVGIVVKDASNTDEKYLASLRSWEFNIFDFQDEEIPHVMASMFLDLDLVYDGLDRREQEKTSGFTSLKTLLRFLELIKVNYNSNNSYHNLYHCADVTHSTYLIIRQLKHLTHLSHLECFALMISAVAHDLDHPGVNNIYLVNSRHPLAVTYNDLSVLENKHAATLYQLIESAPDANIFKTLSQYEWREVRKVIIQSIIHTDMTKHFPLMSKMEVFTEMHGSEIEASQRFQMECLRKQACSDKVVEFPDPMHMYESREVPVVFESDEDRMLLFASILHGADISNPARPSHIAARWAHMVTEEFFMQGDLEKKNGFPVSPLCDREDTNLPLSQANFIEFIVAPFYDLITRIFPDMGKILHQVLQNWHYWQELRIDSNIKNDDVDNVSMNRMNEKYATSLDKYTRRCTLLRSSNSPNDRAETRTSGSERGSDAQANNLSPRPRRRNSSARLNPSDLV